ncbi:cyclic AMP-dependent transcription factor ATF-1 isoform X9 [Canis lupus familiaris]|uniref:Activating transcription factor 1 n=3 Tax=Canis lupus familiaris TaxID=9615 RepID=A0A8P0NAG8_CANLF|nr:cyclic AMP-dependent transcription factor ATF-1 isoform X9 [Canis lupus familiaris]XP_022267074.2 cyclic AMP-dependent transcription factor ATF-1 isoform X9 [Canis lupus familiaris]XP_022267075.2 cyclic AMP-dependent transcription factor ATF-1 isoform X9 [Canis lupus familiaris]XP_022267077.2 cyclic AMP-dependent transcription factor ATF-1 isoform X9 [Canis lupus familiaris]XP_038316035.1 cyclic AMP-dependent transcription factor ATF-1 isoform X9 [Canis lupus familiaris]XP_038316036.1 cycli
MEDSHKSNTSEAAPQPGSTVQGAHISHIAQQMALRGSAPVTIIPLPGEQVQVQGVIQTAQSSVIHPPHVQTVSSLSESEESQDSSDSIGSSQKAHGILARRPSYRKILKDLSSEDTRGRKGDGENPGVSAVTSMSVPTPIYQTSSGQYIAIAPNGALQLASPGTDGVQGLQTLTMTNSGSTQQGTTILQYAQTSDGQQILVPSNQVVVQTASGDMQTYQIRTTPSATSLPQTVVMTSPVTLTSQTTKTDDPQLKREIRLMKNRSFNLILSAHAEVIGRRQNHYNTIKNETDRTCTGIWVPQCLFFFFFFACLISDPNLCTCFVFCFLLPSQPARVGLHALTSGSLPDPPSSAQGRRTPLPARPPQLRRTTVWIRPMSERSDAGGARGSSPATVPGADARRPRR